jgi:hypothetical protein
VVKNLNHRIGGTKKEQNDQGVDLIHLGSKRKSEKAERIHCVLFYLFTLSLLPFDLSVAESRSRCTCSCTGSRWPLLAETASVTLAGIYRFELCFLSRRNEVSVLFEILNDLFADDLTLKPSQGAFDRFVIVN